MIGAVFYLAYQEYVMFPYYKATGWPVHEKRLEPALVSAFAAPIGLFIFGVLLTPHCFSLLTLSLH